MTQSKRWDILIYQASDGAIEIKGDFDQETVWANQWQISGIFGVDRTVITRHINNLFKDKEIDQKRNVQILHIANSDKPVKFYSMDVILAVGYRTKSSVAIKFRQRATQTLRQHITQGYTINPKRLQYNYDSFLEAVDKVKKLVHNKELPSDDVLELIKFFGQTWFSLNAYDTGKFSLHRPTTKRIRLQAEKLSSAVAALKTNLLQKWEATDFFAQERGTWSLEWILGNVLQTAGGKDVYPSIESKAAHLLYFVIKNHPFTDGNKRTGAFAFVRFLQIVWYNFRTKITPEALTTITLLIATSDPQDKERVVDLVMLLLQG